ncbi:MAG TPA: class I SAM-dependent methyltransferase [Prolixibacteraceae bacterium]|nr:class I SAM-dependent methyltransferase [Prolixibacteraceae bacterium]
MNSKIGQVAQTAFLTLQCHALDARSNHPILNDVESTEILEALKEKTGLSDFGSSRIKKSLINHIALRARQYDLFAKCFIEKFPDAAVVNIGCGLDNRFKRIDNGKIHFYDLDFPDIISIKEKIIPPTSRYRQFAQSVFDFEWIKEIDREHVFLLAEGVFMYCEPTDVKNLFHELHKRFSNPEIVFEVFNSKWLTGWRGKMMAFRMKKELKLGEETVFKFGIADSDEIESWDSNYRLVLDWSYLDEEEANFPFKNLFRNMDALRKVLWPVHYVLESN